MFVGKIVLILMHSGAFKMVSSWWIMTLISSTSLCTYLKSDIQVSIKTLEEFYRSFYPYRLRGKDNYIFMTIIYSFDQQHSSWTVWEVFGINVNSEYIGKSEACLIFSNGRLFSTSVRELGLDSWIMLHLSLNLYVLYT